MEKIFSETRMALATETVESKFST